MKLLTTLAVVVTALSVGVIGAAAIPDPYQPQLAPSSQPDGYQPQLGNGEPFDRYSITVESESQSGAALHPDSKAVRPGVVSEPEPIADDSLGFSWTSGAVGALGASLVLVFAIVAASAMRERRRLVLR